MADNLANIFGTEKDRLVHTLVYASLTLLGSIARSSSKSVRAVTVKRAHVCIISRRSGKRSGRASATELALKLLTRAKSQTILLIHLYRSPQENLADQSGAQRANLHNPLQKHYEHFYEDVFLELSNYGEVEEVHVVDNLGDHMIGNVYCKFKSEESADLAQKSLMGRFYSGVPVMVELSPVTDFREARCRYSSPLY